MDINPICISETSQLNDSNFEMPVNIQHYTIYTTVTLTGKGLVAIHVKHNLEANENRDLKTNALEYDTVWIVLRINVKTILS